MGRKQASDFTRTKVLTLRLKDKHAAWLRLLAREVNFVFNFCNELSLKVLERERRFIGAHELQSYLNGASREGLQIGSAVFQQIAEEYVTRRRQHRKAKLRWRVSGGARRSLGWIPFKSRAARYAHGQVYFQGRWLSLWDSYGLADYRLRAGDLTEDARGRWYLNVTIDVPKRPVCGRYPIGPIGLDLGLEALVTTSGGLKVRAPRYLRGVQDRIAVAQRARKKARVRALHAKAANRRRDLLHKLSTALVKSNDAIVIGNVNAKALCRGRHATSVHDAGWSTFRAMLRYKCDIAGVPFVEVDEAYSTQTCSVCSARSGPQGIAGLGMRGWTCCECGAVHDRDVNAARNILAAGHRRLAEGIPAL